MQTIRYVVDIENYGLDFLVILKSHIKKQAYSIKDNIPINEDDFNYNQRLLQLYQEFFNQIFLTLTSDLNTFSLNLRLLPDFTYFKHVPEFADEHRRILLSNIFKELALNIFNIVKRRTTVEGEYVDYLLEAATPTYLVLLKITKDYSYV